MINGPKDIRKKVGLNEDELRSLCDQMAKLIQRMRVRAKENEAEIKRLKGLLAQ